MATLAAYPVTNSGDETTPAELWAAASPTTLRTLDAFIKNKYASPVTAQGDDINPAELWSVALPTTVHIANFNRSIRAQDSVFDPMAGYVFVLSPATLQPQVPRSTQFPYAQ
jgi:hypothetical protein